MKLTQMDSPAPEGHTERETAGPLDGSQLLELFPMQSLRQSMGTIKGVPRSDGDDTKSVSGVTNDSLYGAAVRYDRKTFRRRKRWRGEVRFRGLRIISFFFFYVNARQVNGRG